MQAIVRRKLVQTSAEDKFIYTMPSAAELARSECLSVVLIYKLATLVVRNPREASCACLPRDLLLQALPIKLHLISQRPQAKAVTLRGEVGAPSEN